HKPVCAFWRYSGKNQWITNTSQGGSMSYKNVPMNALELAVNASKASKAEYFACDIAIDENTNKAYILECATAFAAFPYIRDWICQYLMWDFSKGKYPKPHIPLFSWEELGKIDSNLLRTLRNITFGKYTQSYDGERFIKDKEEIFEMEMTDESKESDMPFTNVEDLNIQIDKQNQNEQEFMVKKIDFNKASLTDLMTLYGMEEDLAIEIKEYLQDNIITDCSDLLELESIDEQMLKSWEDNIDDMRIDINCVNKEELKKIKGIGNKLAKIISDYREKIGKFVSIEDLKNIEGIGKNKFAQLKSRLKVGE
ncbi:MAG: helix-hairpin-helix domain-containing protein, partial [Arcobacter sp.]